MVHRSKLGKEKQRATRLLPFCNKGYKKRAARCCSPLAECIRTYFFRSSFTSLAAFSIFLAPSTEELRKRLEARGTETEQTLKERLDKAAYELGFADRFDRIIVNDNLEQAIAETIEVIDAFLKH